MSVHGLGNGEEFNAYVKKIGEGGKSNLCAVFFWADFHASCKPNGQLDQLFRHLAKAHESTISFFKVEVEKAADIAQQFGVSVVPTFIFFKDGDKLDYLESAKPAELAKRIDALKKTGAAGATGDNSSANTVFEKLSEATITDRLRRLTNASQVMLFMKGSPQEPRCKFSRETVELLNDANIKFGSFDILSDEQVRQQLKTFSNWATYPQLYVNGELIGGLDILKEMKEEGELSKHLGIEKVVRDAKEDLNTRLKALVSSAPVLLFMKGNPQEPKCGFSRTTVQLLRDHHVPFSTFDILSDEEVRQGLKTLFDWPTYPQLYVKGELQGGLDVLKEMAEDGNLAEQLGVEDGNLAEQLGL